MVIDLESNKHLGRKGLQYVREATIRVFWQQATQTKANLSEKKNCFWKGIGVT